jgi:hypothetical protein
MREKTSTLGKEGHKSSCFKETKFSFLGDYQYSSRGHAEA